MYAQRKTSPNSRQARGRHGYRAAPIRAQVGLAVRPSMNYGDMPDAVSVLRASGLSLSPIAVSDAAANVGGAHIMPTAKVSDIESGDLKGLVVPAGAGDAASAQGLADAIFRTRSSGASVLAFGEGVTATLSALGETTTEYADAPAILVQGDQIRALGDLDALATAASRLG